MLPSQRALFDIPSDVCFFNAASYSPLPLATLKAGRGSTVHIPDARVRAPHILSLGFRGGMPPGLIERLAAENIHVAPRIGRMRISPHVYNDEGDVDRFIAAFHRLVSS